MQRQQGFTLIEILIAVVIVGILTAVAVPAYSDYVVRTRLSEAFTGLAGLQPSAEQYWSNNRTFAGFAALPANSDNFTFALSNDTASTYTVTATGRGPSAGFVFTVDQSGNRATTGVPSGWTAKADCWTDRKDGRCAGQ